MLERGKAPPQAAPVQPPRLFGSLRELSATLLGILHTRLALAGIELEEEIQRLLVALVMALGMLLFSALGLLVFTLMIVMAFWEEHRIAALAVLSVVYLGIGGLFWMRLQAGLAERPQIFAATLAELERDRAALRGVRDGEDEQ